MFNKKSIIYIAVSVLLLVIYLLFASWHDGDRKKLDKAEIDQLMTKIQKNLTPERTGHVTTPEAYKMIRDFAEADDGNQFYMINLIKLNEKAKYPEGKFPNSTILDAKKRYVEKTKGILLTRAGYPAISIAKPGAPVVTDSRCNGTWDQFFLVRYRSRRDFMNMLATDEYAASIVHKWAADAETLLVPVTGVSINSGLKTILGSFLLAIFAIMTVFMAGVRNIFKRS